MSPSSIKIRDPFFMSLWSFLYWTGNLCVCVALCLFFDNEDLVGDVLEFCGVYLSIAVESMISSPFLIETPSFGNIPRRIFGPWRSWSRATFLLCLFAAFLTFVAISLKFKYDPCEKLSRATSRPAWIRSSMVARLSEEGPRVATIFVKLIRI